MTPQQKKADELVERYLPLITMVDKYSYVLKHESNSLAIQCAIICVGDLIKENESILEMLIMHGTERTRIPLITRLDELQSVLNELKSRL